MRIPILAAAAAAVAFTAALPSQSVVLPTSIATTGGVPSGGTSGIFSTTEEAWQGIYDGSNFASQGVTYPVVISHLDLRGESNRTTGGGSYTSMVSMSSAAPGTWMAPSLTYATNHGPNLTQLFNGAHTVAIPLPQTPNIFVAPFPLSPLFPHDPTTSDLIVEIRSTPGGGSVISWIDRGATGADQAAYLRSNIGPGAALAPTASSISYGRGVAIELKYVPAPGLHPNFNVDVSSGNPSLTVNFTDVSYTSDPNGIVLYEWDLDGDGVFEQVGVTLTAVSHTYTACGRYSPSLRVTDTLHGQVTKTKTNLIDVEPISAGFNHALTGNPNEVAFTDTSVNVTSWSWDFDSNGVIDSTLQNPTHVYPTGETFTCTLTVSNSCKTDSITHSVPAGPAGICTTFAGGNGQTGNAFEIVVTNPNGILIQALDVNSNTGSNVTIYVYLTGDTYNGKVTMIGVWRQVATGIIATSTGGGPNFVDINDIYLPPGSYGMAVLSSNSVAYTNGFGINQTYSNADLTLNLGNGISEPPGGPGSVFNPRVWNGCIYYSTSATSTFGFNGESCPSSAGHVLQALSAGSLPQIGTTLSIDVGPLPVGSPFHFMVIGFDNTNYAGIPLPVDLGTVPAANMPGCIGRCSIDQLGLFNDLGGFGIFSIGVPNSPPIVGLVAFTQPYVLDANPPHGGRPMVAGDAAGMRIGQ